MVRRVLIIAAVLIVAGFVYLGYTNYDANRAGLNGDVYSVDGPESKTPESKLDAKKSTAPVSAPEYTVTKPASARPTPPPSQEGPVAPSPDQTTQPGTTASAASAPPATDTIQPNPPNGMVFSGTGHFQLYRQGNLTWRLNTDTGQSCILFATNEEWKKPRVRRAGCGKR